MHAGGILTLPDGAEIRIRQVDGSDRAALLAGFDRLSPESRFLRFFSGVPRMPDEVLDRLTDVDQHRHVALGVFDPSRASDVGSSDGLGIGVGRYFVSQDDPTVAEAAVAVIDEYQGRGIGTLLLQSLVVFARERGIRTFTADVLAENARMAAVFDTLGGTPVPEASNLQEVRFEVDVPAAAEPLKATTGYKVMRELAARS
ncbi:MAG: N-acetyltransferase family protein [Acidimicrobiales bacterium]